MLTIITLSHSATALALRIAGQTPSEVFTLRNYAVPGTTPFDNLAELVTELFATRKKLLFIMATGIVVRTIAPHLVHKAQDPAVLVADEQGRFIISLLSGHLGGANTLATDIAARIGACPVITTATDIQGLQAVDMFAQKHGLLIENFQDAKTITALILQGKALRQENDTCIPVPIEYSCDTDPEGIIRITNKIQSAGPLPTVNLLARNIVLGIGCRRGVEAERITAFVESQLAGLQINPRCIARIASVDLKSDEPGILQTARYFGADTLFIPRSEIEPIQDQFTGSSFVSSQIGIAAVCEPTAWLAGGGKGRFLLRKTAYEGITLAIFEMMLSESEFSKL